MPYLMSRQMFISNVSDAVSGDKRFIRTKATLADLEELQALIEERRAALD